MATLTDEQRLRRTTKALRPIAEALGIWQTQFIYQDFAKKIENENGDRSRATCTAMAPYRRIYITWDRSYVDQAKPDELRRTALHELIHGMVFAEMDRLVEAKKATPDAFGELQENATDLIALWLYQFGGKEMGFGDG